MRYLAVLIIALPFMVHAQAATDAQLAAQIQALLQQVAALQQQVTGSSGAAPQTPATGAAGVPAQSAGASLQCPHVSRVLKRGMSGQDVTRLQQFLALDPSVYPEAQVTGFYGALTEKAVQRFQCKNKLVCDGAPATTGYGVTGPRTAALLALQCPDVLQGGGGAGGFIRVYPTSGTAPLNVAVEATVNTTRSCRGETYEVIFGDNSASATIVVPPNYCNEMRQTLNHTYPAGTHTVILRSGIHQTQATVTVAPGSTDGTITATPLTGQVPLAVRFTGTMNTSGACNAGGFTIQFGDGQTARLPDPGCGAAGFNVDHTFVNPGTYAVRLFRDTTPHDAKSVTINAMSGTGGGVGGGPFSVTPGQGGNPMAVSAQFSLSSSCGRYDLDWGDGTAHATQGEGSCAAGATTKTLTHTYTAAGNYTLTLKRGANLEYTDPIALVIVQ